MNDETYALTPWGCLYAVLLDYGIDVSHITPKMGEHMVNDFMESMMRAGYVTEKENEGKVAE